MNGNNGVNGSENHNIATLDEQGNCINRTCPLREICAPVLRARENEQVRATDIMNHLPDFIDSN